MMLSTSSILTILESNLDNDLGIIPGSIVKHFKHELLTEEDLIKDPLKYTYTVICFAKDADTCEDYVVYVANYDNSTSKIWIRKAMEFFSEVDHNKYPTVKQKYKYELIKE